LIVYYGPLRVIGTNKVKKRPLRIQDRENKEIKVTSSVKLVISKTTRWQMNNKLLLKLRNE